jgi:hypothetical protein
MDPPATDCDSSFYKEKRTSEKMKNPFLSMRRKMEKCTLTVTNTRRLFNRASQNTGLSSQSITNITNIINWT